jgi:hypothetical protein
MDGIYAYQEGKRWYRCDLINTREMHPAQEAVKRFYRRF